MIRHRSRMFLAVALAAVMSVSVSASAGPPEFTHGPSWKAPVAQSAHAPVEASAKAMPVMVAELPAPSMASGASSAAVGAVPAAALVASGAVAFSESRPREKPRLCGAALAVGSPVLHANFQLREKPRLWAVNSSPSAIGT